MPIKRTTKSDGTKKSVRVTNNKTIIKLSKPNDKTKAVQNRKKNTVTTKEKYTTSAGTKVKSKVVEGPKSSDYSSKTKTKQTKQNARATGTKRKSSWKS